VRALVPNTHIWIDVIAAAYIIEAHPPYSDVVYQTKIAWMCVLRYSGVVYRITWALCRQTCWQFPM